MSDDFRGPAPERTTRIGPCISASAIPESIDVINVRKNIYKTLKTRF